MESDKIMKQNIKSSARKIFSSILVAALMFALIPKITGTGTALAYTAASKNTDDTCLGTSGIAAPDAPASAASPWSGS